MPTTAAALPLRVALVALCCSALCQASYAGGSTTGNGSYIDLTASSDSGPGVGWSFLNASGAAAGIALASVHLPPSCIIQPYDSLYFYVYGMLRTLWCYGLCTTLLCLYTLIPALLFIYSLQGAIFVCHFLSVECRWLSVLI